MALCARCGEDITLANSLDQDGDIAGLKERPQRPHRGGIGDVGVVSQQDLRHLGDQVRALVRAASLPSASADRLDLR